LDREAYSGHDNRGEQGAAVIRQMHHILFLQATQTGLAGNVIQLLSVHSSLLQSAESVNDLWAQRPSPDTSSSLSLALRPVDDLKTNDS
jgi:hypothetical protein